MKLITAFLIIFVFVLGASTITASDLRNATWGMSLDQVKKVEDDSLISESNDGKESSLAYHTTCTGLDAYLAYYFWNDSLYMAGYMITKEESNGRRYLQYYLDLKEAISSKYGQPDEDLHSYDYPYEEGDGHFDTALRTGSVRYFANWDNPTPTTRKIRLILTGENYKVRLGLRYESPSASRILKDQEEETINNDL